MSKALCLAEEAKKQNEVPIGAVVVFENRIIGCGYNRIQELRDATAHAEIFAMKEASSFLKNKFLNNCDLYVSLEPCSMCAGAAILFRLRSIYFAAFDTKAGACGSVYNLPSENKLNHKIEIYNGLLEDESISLLKQFFSHLR